MASRYCSRCGKALKACICQHITALHSDVELIILQHPSEEHRPMGTARILSLSLNRCHHIIGEDFSNNEELNQLLSDTEYQHYVLYPCDEAIEVSQIPSATHSSKKIRVILLDGTWKKAFKIWQLSTNLSSLPVLALPDDLIGNYRIRKAPSENSLSTVEAGFHILTILQPEQDFSPLLNTFNEMIEFQIRQMPAGVYERNYKS
ncbi:tRNA-uridine aminocarboxypropyltransferase [Vibrio viridaestus]|uniref:tRNA-uridine aminocarboxypropyltransferase n=1 Tax=Vibrio viridaestus TaxID=2487322 RepID=A0A3N9TJ03_9VIBR|nr:DTW domain-containing protein [Vibrio viridaestus]RQW64239.1 DTW domain-containing protein [Vibrio viridaestus]